MKRRKFLKLLGIAPLAPSVLAATPKYTIGVDMAVGESKVVCEVWDAATKTIILEDNDFLSFGSSDNCLIVWDGYSFTIESKE